MITFRMYFFQVVVLFFSSLTVFAAPIRKEVKDLLLEKGQFELIQQYEAIPTLTPTEFSELVAQSKLKLVGAGWNGVAFKNPGNELFKFEHSIFGAPGVMENWLDLRSSPFFVNLQLDMHSKVNFADIALRRSAEKEILGTLLWSAYYPEAIEFFPDMISTDGTAYRRHFIPGTPLGDILTAADSPYNMKKIWEQVVSYQNTAEQMLFETGIQVDTLSPSNFIVQGDYDNPILKLGDHELVGPTPSAVQYYAARGIRIPESAVANSFKMILWPLMPEHIVMSLNWGLTFDQSVEYMMARHGFVSRTDALAALAALPRWKNDLFSFLMDYKHLDRAQALLQLSPCERPLAF